MILKVAAVAWMLWYHLIVRHCGNNKYIPFNCSNFGDNLVIDGGSIHIEQNIEARKKDDSSSEDHHQITQ
jgi:hypothetical protein